MVGVLGVSDDYAMVHCAVVLCVLWRCAVDTLDLLKVRYLLGLMYSATVPTVPWSFLPSLPNPQVSTHMPWHC